MNFEDMFNSDSKSNSDTNNSNGEDNEGCKDIPNGFQDVDPRIFTLIGGLLGDALAGSLPLSAQNALGNWFCLVGQAMLAYAAQQAYFESGPGRCYNVKNRNITNPFCPSHTSNISNLNSDGTNKAENIETLNNSVNDLLTEVNKLKEEMKNLKSKKR